MNEPHLATTEHTGALSKALRSLREKNVPWFALYRWAFGVFGPILCFGLAVTRLDGAPMVGPRSGMLVFAAVCVLAQLVSNLRPARGDLVSAVLAGVLRSACIVGVLYSMMLTPLAAVFLALSPAAGLVGLLPLAATYVYFRSARLEERSCREVVPRACAIVLVCGFLLPAVLGWVATRSFDRMEARIVASYVDTKTPADVSQLDGLRTIAWMHDWPELERIYRDWASEVVRQRAGDAWSALTGRPAETLSPID